MQCCTNTATGVTNQYQGRKRTGYWDIIITKDFNKLPLRINYVLVQLNILYKSRNFVTF